MSFDCFAGYDLCTSNLYLTVDRLESVLQNVSSSIHLQNISDNNEFYIQLLFTLITIVSSFLVAFLTIILQEKRNQRNVIIDSCKSLIDEINLSKEILAGKTDDDIINTMDKNPEPLEEIFPIDTYHGVITSANYIQINENVRVKLASYYNRLKQHNDKVVYLNYMKDRIRLYQISGNNPEIVIAEIKKSMVTMEGQLVILREECLDELKKQIAMVVCEYD